MGIKAIQRIGGTLENSGFQTYVFDNLKSAKNIAFDNAKMAITFDAMLSALQPVASIENDLAAAFLSAEKRLQQILNPPDSHSIHDLPYRR
jgi:hypothetical protein